MSDNDDRRHDERREDDRRIWVALNAISERQARQDERLIAIKCAVDEVRTDLKHLNAHGCALASTHGAHERRIEGLESRAGSLALAGGGGGVLGGVLAALGQWIWQRVQGG